MTALPTSGTAMRGELGNTLDTGATRVFTIFCHGTGGHRDGKCEELITEFGGAYWYNGLPATRPTKMSPDGSGTAQTGFIRKPRHAQPRSHVSDFYRDHYQKDFLILDGVGTTDMWNDFVEKDGTHNEIGLPGVPNPMPGDFNPFCVDKPLKDESAFTLEDGTPAPEDLRRRVSNLWLAKMGGKKHRGDIYGDGWNDNIAHALWVLARLRKADVDNPDQTAPKVFPRVINTIGWSRGGVTTIKLAYWIHAYFVEGRAFRVPQGYHNDDQESFVDYMKPLDAKYHVPETELEMNIFAIDPVPGRAGANGNWGKSNKNFECFPTVEGDQDYRYLPTIVNNCFVTLASDERRMGFHPIDGETEFLTGRIKLDHDASKTNLVFLPYPGIHRSQLRLKARDPAGDIDKDMRLKNIRNGTRLGSWRKHDESEDEARDRIKAHLEGVPKLVWDLAWKFLTFHGTKFQRADLPSTWGGLMTGQQICDAAAEVIRNRVLYHTARNRGGKAAVQGGLTYRAFTGYPRDYRPVPAHELLSDKLNDYCRGDITEFLNEHHYAVYMALTATMPMQAPADPPPPPPHDLVATATRAYESDDHMHAREGEDEEEDTGSQPGQALDPDEAEDAPGAAVPPWDRGTRSGHVVYAAPPPPPPVVGPWDIVATPSEGGVVVSTTAPAPQGYDPAAWPLQRKARPGSKIFPGLIENMTRSQRFNARGVPVVLANPSTVDSTPFLDALIPPEM